MYGSVYCAECKRTTGAIDVEDWRSPSFHARQMHKAADYELAALSWR